MWAQCNPKCPYKREAGGEREESSVITETRRYTGGFEDEGRATSQEMSVAPGGRKREGKDSPLEPPGGTCPADILALAQ